MKTKKELKLDEVNVINPEDTGYYSNCYRIGISVSNALGALFEVNANCEQDALDILADWLRDDYPLFYDKESDIEPEYMDDYICAGNYSDVYFNVGYISITKK